MTVLISGGTGFVGLNVAEALLARGDSVVLYALDTLAEGARRALDALPGELVVETGDVRDATRFTAALRRHGVTRLLPFAAITSGPDRERDAPERVIETNLVGFVEQLRAAREAGVRRVIAPSSSAIYGESFYAGEPMDEARTPCVPIGLYGVTKYAVERSALRLGDLWGLDMRVARIGAVFGPWERDTGLRDFLSPHWQLARNAVAGREAVLPDRILDYPWVYARDVAAALLHLLDLPDAGPRVFNICSGLAWGARILDWARALANAYPGFRWRQSADPADVTIRFSESLPRARVSIARLQATGWRPHFMPELAYPDYLAWLRAHADALR